MALANLFARSGYFANWMYIGFLVFLTSAKPVKSLKSAVNKYVEQ